jgi:hypothetical protein
MDAAPATLMYVSVLAVPGQISKQSRHVDSFTDKD